MSICRGVIKVAAFTSTGIILAIMLITAVDVLLRYRFSRPITGVSETSEYLLVILVFLALAYAQFQGRHVSVRLVINRLPVGAQKTLNIGILVTLLALFLAMTWKSAEVAYSFQQLGETRWNVPVPVWPARFFVSIGAFLLSLELLLELISFLKALRAKG
jgi:TRAP-type C4-dicarboxylate transport system permease small subunit